MKLLVITQKVDINDDLLGFFHKWLEELAARWEKLTVITLGQGETKLPANVRVLSLGKEKGAPRMFRKSIYTWNFFKLIIRERKNYDAVFVHMNQEYVILGGLLWKLWNKKIGFWYVHKKVSFKLRLAEKLADYIFTASEEGFRLGSKKVLITGHGINTEQFSPAKAERKPEGAFKIIYVGRISPIKNQKLLVEALDILVNKKGITDSRIKFIGAPVYPEDEAYLGQLKEAVRRDKLEGCVDFIGSVPYREISKYYAEADLAVNLCPTGGMDKAVLEAMAAGLPVIAYNKAFVSLFGQYAGLMVLENDDKIELAKKITALKILPLGEKIVLSERLISIVKERYSLGNLIEKITKKFQSRE
ncbi:MAG: glycosyltransferase family 4 protein [Patescibacteria group bacterium]|jgi:glycosyltransferase involved in cell wall biosynthesis